MAEDPTHWLQTRGPEQYDGEAVTQLAHALQAAALADAAGASDALVIAALLHDIGHLLPASFSNATGADRHHQRLGARYLARFFGPEVFEPVRLHVEAKRMLCRDAAYLSGLSEESQRSLVRQGGVHEDWEAEGFSALPHAEEATRLRHWDDQAKVVGLTVPSLDTYAERIRSLRRARPEGS